MPKFTFKCSGTVDCGDINVGVWVADEEGVGFDGDLHSTGADNVDVADKDFVDDTLESVAKEFENFCDNTPF